MLSTSHRALDMDLKLPSLADSPSGAGHYRCRPPTGGHKMPGPKGNVTAQQDVKDSDHPIGGGGAIVSEGSLSLSTIKCQMHMP